MEIWQEFAMVTFKIILKKLYGKNHTFYLLKESENGLIIGTTDLERKNRFIFYTTLIEKYPICPMHILKHLLNKSLCLSVQSKVRHLFL